MAPVIREHHAKAEWERRLSPPVLAALHDAGLLRMFTPRSRGWLEVDPLTHALAIEEISGHDTAAGWTLANPLAQAYICTRLPDAGAEEIYGRGAHVVIAGQFGQTASKFPLRWWIIHSTLSRRDQLDEPSGPYSGRMRLPM